MSVSATIEFIGALLIFVGGVMAVISAIGLIRFPDVYTRSHAATKSSTLAVLLTLTGALVYILIVDGYFSIRLILGIVFVFLTAPVSGHLVTRAAYRSNVKLADISIEDALADVIDRKKEGLKEEHKKIEDTERE